jgi:MOSC domain-containing protein YiiM
MTGLQIATLRTRLEWIRAAPADGGRLELIARRPATEQRELLDEAVLDADDGLVGDNWCVRPSSTSLDGGPTRDAQVTIMSARAAAAVSGGDDRERWALAGDQLYVDLDISQANLPPGSRLRIGGAVLEVTALPHAGCGKFSRRFGVDAVKFVNSTEGRALRLRGLNARVVEPGSIAAGDAVDKLES